MEVTSLGDTKNFGDLAESNIRRKDGGHLAWDSSGLGPGQRGGYKVIKDSVSSVGAEVPR